MVLYIPLLYQFVNMYSMCYPRYTFFILFCRGGEIPAFVYPPDKLRSDKAHLPRKTSYAPMAELVDALALGAGIARCRGSSPLGGTFVLLGFAQPQLSQVAGGI